MKKRRLQVAVWLVLCVLALAAAQWGRAGAARPEPSFSPDVHVWGSQLTVYYPEEKKIYVYSELGGNCVFVYTLSGPGGPIARENCR
jgi:hypothetical protein